MFAPKFAGKRRRSACAAIICYRHAADFHASGIARVEKRLRRSKKSGKQTC
jgi:hypothetical protein